MPYDTDFIITSFSDDGVMFWQGKYGWSENYGFVQRYKSVEAANRACVRMKRKWRGPLAKNAKYVRWDEVWLDENTMNMDLLDGRKASR